MPKTEILFVGRHEMDRATHISKWFLPEGYQYENIVPRDLSSDSTLAWVLRADNVRDYSEQMGVLYALTGCRAPEALTELGTDVYIGYCDAGGEPTRPRGAAHIGWTLISGASGVTEAPGVPEKAIGAAS